MMKFTQRRRTCSGGGAPYSLIRSKEGERATNERRNNRYDQRRKKEGLETEEKQRENTRRNVGAPRSATVVRSAADIEMLPAGERGRPEKKKKSGNQKERIVILIGRPLRASFQPRCDVEDRMAVPREERVLKMAKK